MNMQDRYRGCLVGLACGDALGGPVEFVSRDEIARRFPDGVRDFVGGGWLDLEPGEITDDTQMTLDLARSLAIRGPVDMKDLAGRFIAWAAGDPKDIGNTTRAAIRLLTEGAPWTEAGERVYRDSLLKEAAGNGSVMRCAPVALRFRHDPQELRQVSIDTARITHADPCCTWGAVVVNQAIVRLLHGHHPARAFASSLEGIDEPALQAAVASLPTLERSSSGRVGTSSILSPLPSGACLPRRASRMPSSPPSVLATTRTRLARLRERLPGRATGRAPFPSAGSIQSNIDPTSKN